MLTGAVSGIKRALYRRLPLEKYLRTVSRGYFALWRSGLGRFSNIYEYPRLLKYFVRKGDVVIDIGANLGYYSWFLARLAGPAGRVYAVEPVPPIFEVLKHNLRRFGNVEFMNYALGTENKVITMANDTPAGAPFATGRNYVAGGEAGGGVTEDAPAEFRAEMRRGSELFARLERLDFVKCDIEGYEGVVIPEMEPVIERFRPVVLVESGGETRGRIAGFFNERLYEGFVAEDGRLRPAAPDDEKDIFFIPSGAGGRYRKLIRR